MVDTYEHSVKVAEEEVRNTIEKLKQNGNYYESMIKLQEQDYEQEVVKLQADFVDQQTEYNRAKKDLDNREEELQFEF